MQLSDILLQQPIRYNGDNRVYFLVYGAKESDSILWKLTQEKQHPDYVRGANLVALVQDAALERMRAIFAFCNHLAASNGERLGLDDVSLLSGGFYGLNTAILQAKKSGTVDAAIRFPDYGSVQRFLTDQTERLLLAESNIRNSTRKKRMYYGFLDKTHTAFGNIPGNKRITGPKLRKAAKFFLDNAYLTEPIYGHATLRIPMRGYVGEFYLLTADPNGDVSLLHYKEGPKNYYWERHPIRDFGNDIRIGMEKEKGSVVIIVDSQLKEFFEKNSGLIAHGRNISRVIISM